MMLLIQLMLSVAVSTSGSVDVAALTTPPSSPAARVPLFRLFEMQVTNTNTSAVNKYTDVWLNATFVEPSSSGRHIPFFGFYDGGTDSLWKLRFMPNVTGRWSFHYSFSDGSMQGTGEFDCVLEGRSPGIMMPLKTNPRWFSYGGDKPVFIKSYYVKAGGITRQPIDWVSKNVYQKMVDRGYNHHMSSGFLPVLPLTAAWDGQELQDGPAAINHTIYTDPTSPSTSMMQDVWTSLEEHLGFLNDHDIAVDFFQGFSSQGPDSGHLQFGAMNETEKRWWVSYVVARLAPYANIFGYVYSWETGGRGDDLHLAELLHEFDIFRHMVTYEDANAIASNWYNLTDWDFASVEVYGGVDAHHNMTLDAYRGKPVYFTEAHLLWRSFWFAAEASIPSTAWAITTAGGSWTWNDMGDHRITGPYRANQAFRTYPTAIKAVDILADIMVNKTTFHLLTPADHLLGGVSGSNGASTLPPITYCLAQPGVQYLVYSDSGQSFDLDLGGTSAAVHFSVTWYDAIDDQHVIKALQNVTGGAVVKLEPPSTTNHWIGLLLTR